MHKKKEDDIEKKVDETLNLLNKVNRLQPKPFLYTRIMARWQNDAPKAVPSQWRWAVKVSWPMLVAIVILNLATLLVYRPGSSTSNHDDQALLFIEEYGILYDGMYAYEE